MKITDATQILQLTGTVSKDDIKIAYKRLAKAYHPDKNPAGLVMMQLINAAYDVLKDFETLDCEDSQTLTDYPEKLSDAINAIVGLDLEIEVCGLWVWVSGDTKPHKEILKESGYKWASKKKMWYFRPEDEKKARYGKTYEMGTIREKYGSQKVDKQARRKIAA